MLDYKNAAVIYALTAGGDPPNAKFIRFIGSTGYDLDYKLKVLIRQSKCYHSERSLWIRYLMTFGFGLQIHPLIIVERNQAKEMRAKVTALYKRQGAILVEDIRQVYPSQAVETERSRSRKRILDRLRYERNKEKMRVGSDLHHIKKGHKLKQRANEAAA